jgi:WD40 repeat protein
MLPAFCGCLTKVVAEALTAEVLASWLLALALLLVPAKVAVGQEPTVLPTRLDLVPRIALSPDGKLLAANTRDDSLNLWDVATAKLVRTIPTGTVRGLCFSPDGKAVLIAQQPRYSRYDPNTKAFIERAANLVRTWDVATGQEKGRWEFSGGGRTVGFTPDGKLVATDAGFTSGADKTDFTVRVWDIAAQKEVAALKGHTYYAFFLSCSPDGNLLATAGPELKLWDRRTWLETRLGDKPPKGGAPAFSPDSKLLAIASSAESTQPGKTVDGQPEPVGPSALNLWDLEKPLEPRSFKRSLFMGHEYTCAAFSPDGKTLAVGWSHRRQVQLWDVATGKLKAELPVMKVTYTALGEIKGDFDRALIRAGVRQLVFIADGKKLVTANTDGTLLVWDLSKAP